MLLEQDGQVDAVIKAFLHFEMPLKTWRVCEHRGGGVMSAGEDVLRRFELVELKESFSV